MFFCGFYRSIESNDCDTCLWTFKKTIIELFVNILESTENCLQCERTNIAHIVMVLRIGCFIVKVLTGFNWGIWNGTMLCFPIKGCLGHLNGDIHAVIMCYASKGCMLIPLIWINFMFLHNSGNFTPITFYETALISCNHFKGTVISQVCLKWYQVLYFSPRTNCINCTDNFIRKSF